MNQKKIKAIRRKVKETHGIEPFVMVEGKQTRNPHFKKVIGIVKAEYLELPRNKRANYVENGI